jgi:hypothetical protein
MMSDMVSDRSRSSGKAVFSNGKMIEDLWQELVFSFTFYIRYGREATRLLLRVFEHERYDSSSG